MIKRICFFSLATLMLGFVSCKDKDDKDKDKVDEIEPVTVARPLIEDVILTQSFPGNLEAEQEIDIVARVNGTLHVHAESGSKVKKGQLLYTIENTKYANDVAEAQASIKNYQSQYAYNKETYEERKIAFESGAASKNEMDQAKSQMEQSLADITNAQAALREAQTMLGYCSITAPFDGILALQEYDEDAEINGEDNPVKLNTLYNDDVLYAVISVDEKRYAQMVADREKEGFSLDSVRINFEAPLQHEYYSHINYAAPNVSVSTGTVTLRFAIDNPYGELKSGMYMKVVFPYEVSDKAMLIKDASIGTDQLGKYVYLVNDSNKVVYTHITTGELYRDSLRIVESGMTPESRYVTDALLKVRNGMEVKPVEGY